jgi:hypothetical protein
MKKKLFQRKGVMLMNKEELKTRLDQEGINSHYYSLNGLAGGPYDGTHILDKEESKWLVYYFERGLKWDIHMFETEDEACRYFSQWITRDPLTRIYNEPKNNDNS